MSNDPHHDGVVQQFGVSLEQAEGALILLHGRGGSTEDILSLAHELYLPTLTYLAPQAYGRTWYPYSFMAPMEQNEPWLSSALNKVREVVESIEKAGVGAERAVIAGFSQGACLATEFVARQPRRYAGLLALTGGLIGPPDADLSHPGDLAGTPVFFASGDPDPHVPWKRVQQSAAILEGMGAQVTARRYEGRPHMISREELELSRMFVRDAFVGVS
jgi:predicted esterase